MGGPSSLLFALHYPQRTKSLVMISAASHAIPPRPAILATISMYFLMILSSGHGAFNVQKASGCARSSHGGSEATLTREVTQLNAFLESIVPMGTRRNGQLLEQHMSEYDAEQIHNIQVPTLVLHARDDTLVSFEQGEFTAKNIPGAQLIPMEKGGHLALMFNINAGAREILLGFLEQYNSR